MLCGCKLNYLKLVNANHGIFNSNQYLQKLGLLMQLALWQKGFHFASILSYGAAGRLKANCLFIKGNSFIA